MICTMIAAERALRRASPPCPCSSRLDLAVHLVRRLGDEEQAAADQDEIVPREARARRP